MIANGVAGLSNNTELETFYRSYAWFVPIRGGDVHPWAIDAFRAQVQQLTAEIEASSDEFQVTAPTDELATAASSSTAAARRLLLLGGEGGALLLAFTILAAAALRRDITDARRRLVWFGRAQVAGRAAHARRVAVTRDGRHGGRLDRRRRSRRNRRGPGRLAGRPTSSSTRYSQAAGLLPRRASPSPPGCCSTRPCARRRCSSAGSP